MDVKGWGEAVMFNSIYCKPVATISIFNQNIFSSAQSLSRVWLFATPWVAALQASLSITNSWSSPKLMSIESVMPSSHLILCRPLLLLSPIPPSIRVFSKESTLHMRWPKYWSFSFSIIPSKEIPGLISFRMDWKFSIKIWSMLPLLFLVAYQLSTSPWVMRMPTSLVLTKRKFICLHTCCQSHCFKIPPAIIYKIWLLLE